MPTLATCVQTVTYPAPLWLALVRSFFHTQCLLVFVNTSLLLRGRSMTFLVLDSTRGITTTVMAPASLLTRTCIYQPWRWQQHSDIYIIITSCKPCHHHSAKPGQNPAKEALVVSKVLWMYTENNDVGKAWERGYVTVGDFRWATNTGSLVRDLNSCHKLPMN